LSIQKIEYCLGNLDNGSKLVFETIPQQHPELKQQRWGCLGNCSECYKKPFVLIDEKEIIAADSGEELLKKVLDRL
jgi:uncharacterized protein YuzB (UPF0349 family)